MDLFDLNQKKETSINTEFISEHDSTFIKDAVINSFAGKEVFFVAGFDDSKYLLFQLIGNLGGYTAEHKFENQFDFFVIPNRTIEIISLEKNFEIQDIERKLNSKRSPIKHLKIISEKALLEYLKNRAQSLSDNISLKLLEKYTGNEF